MFSKVVAGFLAALIELSNMNKILNSRLMQKNFYLIAVAVFAVVILSTVLAVAAYPTDSFATVDNTHTQCCTVTVFDGGGFGGWGGGFGTNVDGGGGGCFGRGCYDPEPYCTITANPNPSPSAGAPVTLTWTSYLATSATIDHGVGVATPVSGGSIVVYPSTTTTYTMTTDHAVYGGAECQVTVPVPPPSNGCIQVLKETYDTNGNILTPVAQFTFKLDGSVTTVNDANGNAIFNNVSPGLHTVTEILPPTWQLLSVTPVNGLVYVSPGPTCAAVVFKNKQVIETPPPTCTLSITPSVIDAGDAVSLAWATTNATQISIDEDVDGPMTPISGGTVTAHPIQTITYHFHAINEVGQANCQQTVTVRPRTNNSCPVPSSLSDTTTNAINSAPGSEKDLQEILDDDTSYNLQVFTDQKQFQNWTVTSGSHIKITAKHVNYYSALRQVFGFYVNGDISTFTPIYKTTAIPGQESVPLASSGPFTVNPSVGGTIAFAVKSYQANGSLYGVKTSENALNQNGRDQMAAYNPSANKYVLAFEDVIEGDDDFNDLVVDLMLDCVEPVVKGCIQIKKETYNTNNVQITPVAQFTFNLDGNAQTTQNDAAGNAIFNNVSVGLHSVSEIVPPTWTQLSVTPVNGLVYVAPGPVCAAVVFKNKQTITTPPPVTVSVTKIVCNSEADLPNRSGGANITASTATDFLATHPNCRLQPNWVFEWANSSVGNPGDNVTAGGTGWNTLAPTNANGTTTIAIPVSAITGSQIWVREQMQSGYIPFTGASGGNVSAEMYCSDDVLNYDNLDAITNPVSAQTYHCVAWNAVPAPNQPTCVLNAALTSNNNYSLSWSTTNATSFSINQGIGFVTPVAGGSVPVTATTTTTYIGTATGPGGSVNCPTTVTITPNVITPACTLSLSVSSGQIRTGESIKLSWTSSNVTSGFITNYGTTTPVSGGTSEDLFPATDTTYSGTFAGPHGTSTCSVNVRVTTGVCTSNCGGGFNPPNVVMYSKPGETPLVASVFLSQIPYTGFEAGPALTAIFWLAVVLLAGAVAYFALGRRGIVNMFSGHIAAVAGVPTEADIRHTLEERGEIIPEIKIEPVAVSVAAPMPVALPIVSAPVVVPAPAVSAEAGIPQLEDVIESRAHAAGVLMSPEAVVAASELASDRAEVLKLFGTILNDAVRTLPREDGWIMLTSDRLETLAATIAPKVAEKTIVSTAVPTYTIASAKPVAPVEVAHVAGVDEAAAVQFVTSVVSGNRELAFSIIRSMEHDRVSPTTLMTSVATVLDRLYRVRQGGKNGIDAALVDASQSMNDEKLHQLVEVFTHSLDTVYANPFTGVKLALAQAFEIVG